jgi:hypothetical protein
LVIDHTKRHGRRNIGRIGSMIVAHAADAGVRLPLSTFAEQSDPALGPPALPAHPHIHRDLGHREHEAGGGRRREHAKASKLDRGKKRRSEWPDHQTPEHPPAKSHDAETVDGRSDTSPADPDYTGWSGLPEEVDPTAQGSNVAIAAAAITPGNKP